MVERPRGANQNPAGKREMVERTTKEFSLPALPSEIKRYLNSSTCNSAAVEHGLIRSASLSHNNNTQVHRFDLSLHDDHYVVVYQPPAKKKESDVLGNKFSLAIHDAFVQNKLSKKVEEWQDQHRRKLRAAHGKGPKF